ncbi:MAG: acyl-CoA dehydratase activase [Deltaproteobacteria bacterium]|jgi:predicted CoA-substrate-specific enzyme activase|nr:acyl-CoA dehydratase activase [Deltaproteobacteria bacterium]
MDDTTSASGRYYLGLDAGSVSVKVALLDDSGNLREGVYLRHHGRPFHAAYEALSGLCAKYPPEKLHAPKVTGASGPRLASLLSGSRIGEIMALALAAKKVLPEARSLIDIGGEDTKLLWFDPEDGGTLQDFAMNAICAAGTGSFLDQQAHRLGYDISRFGSLALDSKLPPRVAGRCSVFAKSDMIHLQQSATPDYEIIYGLCLAMARSLKGGLAKGRTLDAPVLFTGGVAANPGLARALREILELPGEGLVIPSQSFVFGALGAACGLLEEGPGADAPGLNLAPLAEWLEAPHEPPARQKPLARRPQGPKVSDFDWGAVPEGGKVPVYVGVDVGSVSTNIALVTPEGRLLSRVYLPTAGRPLEAICKGFAMIPPEARDKAGVLGACTTGSGRYLSADYLGADMTVNEITAQATAAVAIDPAVDTIFEIGGQDSKYISVKDGVIVDFMMNKACAAGTGSFLEEQADKLGIDIKGEFGSLALSSQGPVSLGERCTVFMESDLVHHQQNGVGHADLVAGLCHGIVANYLGRVVETRKVGERIFFQGGTSFNEGVASAFESRLGRAITVPDNADVTGAVGAALIARDRKTWDESSFAGFDLSDRDYKVKSFECRHCENVCEIRQVTVKGGKPFHYGSRCDRYDEGRGKDKKGKDLPDLFAFRHKLAYDPPELSELPYGKGPGQVPFKKRVGLARGMFFSELGPFWAVFLASLGLEPVWSPPTSKATIHKGCERTLGEFCFPIKAAHGHLLDLMGMGLDHILIPSIVNMPPGRSQAEADKARGGNGTDARAQAGAAGPKGPKGNGEDISKSKPKEKSKPKGKDKIMAAARKAPDSTACPYNQSLAYTAPAALGLEEPFLVRGPVFFGEGEKALLNSLKALAAKLGAHASEVPNALKAGRKAQDAFQERLLAKGEEALKGLGEDSLAMVVVSRPYNGFDPGLNLRLNEKMRDLGILGIPMDLLPVGTLGDDEESLSHYWRYGQKISQAARIVATDPRLQALYISNFGCGPDSFILHFFKNSLGDKPYLEIEIDEHSSDVGAVTRLEAFLDSLDARRRKGMPPISQGRRPIGVLKGPRPGQTIYIPPMCDHTGPLAAALRRFGLDSEALPPSDQETVDLGRSQTSGKECYPLILTVGDFFKLSQRPGFDPDKSALFMPTSNGPCRFGQYSRYLSLLFRRQGLPGVQVLALDQTGGMYKHLDGAAKARGAGSLSKAIWRALAAVDLLQKALLRARPREKAPGAADLAYSESLRALERAIEDGSVRDIIAELAQGRERFEAAMAEGPFPERPKVGLVGEIYVRNNDFANENIIRRLEALGAEVEMPPLVEWILYTGFVNNMRARRAGDLGRTLKTRLTLLAQDYELSKLAKPFKGFFPDGAKDPPVSEVVRLGEGFLDRSFQGEGILSLGKGMEFFHRGAAGLVNIMPFTCMPGMVVGSLTQRFRGMAKGLPLISLAFDGQSQTNTQSRLEAFMYQVANRRKGSFAKTISVGIDLSGVLKDAPADAPKDGPDTGILMPQGLESQGIKAKGPQAAKGAKGPQPQGDAQGGLRP